MSDFSASEANMRSSIPPSGDPEVSVVIAVRNEQLHVQSAVLSVLAQQGISHEVIVIDDRSTDDTYQVVEHLQASNPSLRLYRNIAAGKCSAFNFGVRQARGRFVCIFAGDDLMPAGSLAARWQLLRDLSADRPVVGLCKLVTMSEVRRFDGHVVPRAPGRGALSGVSPLMNSKALAKIVPVPEGLPNEDTWMELAVLHFPGWTIIHSDIIGCQWRLHEGNSINMMAPFVEYNRKITARMKALTLFDEKYGHELGENRKELRGKIDCEAQRVAGSIWGVLRSPVGLVDKLRALSITNAFMYGIRARLYGLFSGW
jgi:glycosyltransferase involved in cell wall biosynthesis